MMKLPVISITKRMALKGARTTEAKIPAMESKVKNIRASGEQRPKPILTCPKILPKRLPKTKTGKKTREITCVNALDRVAHLASSDSSMMLNTHNHKRKLRYNNALLRLVSLISISWTGWRRSKYHWQLLSYCCINSHRKLR